MNAHSDRPTIDLTIDNLNVLYTSYMPFLTHGGIFVPGTWSYRLGAEVILHLSLFENHAVHVPTTVVWITPQSAGARIRGIGLGFSDTAECKNLKMTIEKRLGDLLESNKPTYTI